MRGTEFSGTEVDLIPYITPLDAVVIPFKVRMGDLWITHHPVEDPSGPGLAHLTYALALQVAARAGARLPTRAEVLLLHDAAAEAGTEIEPVSLPDALQMSAGLKPGDPLMLTLEWAAIHDSRVVPSIRRFATRIQDKPVANAGKHWIGPAPIGKAALCGWHVPKVEAWGSSRTGQGFVQDGTGFPHDDQHHDYATTTMRVWDA